jgi:hypothetical protein
MEINLEKEEAYDLIYYRDKVSNKVYLVVGLCTESSSDRKMVLYTSAIEDDDDKTMYVRYEKRFKKEFEKVIPLDQVESYMKGEN